MTRQESEQIQRLAEQLAELRADVSDRLGRLETHVTYIRERVEGVADEQDRLQDRQSATAAKVAGIAATVSVLVTLVITLLQTHLV